MYAPNSMRSTYSKTKQDAIQFKRNKKKKKPKKMNTSKQEKAGKNL